MYCQNCGKPIRCTSKFCACCGCALPTQKNLITAAMQNDQEAYTALYRQAEKSVRMTVYSIISPDGANNADADDIILESMVKGFKSLEQLTNPDSFTAWMRTIARNKSIDYLRKNRDITFSELTTEDGEDFEDTLVSTDISGSPEMSLDQKTKAALLRDILTSLPEEQRAVLVMYYYHEMKISEIAKELGCTEATVKSRLKYGKSKVEAGVGELEKKHGVRLYSFAPVLLLLLFRGSEKGLGENAGLESRILAAISHAKMAAAAAGAETAASAGTKTAAAGAKTAVSAGIKAGSAAVRTKIVIIAASAVLGTGAAGAGTYAAVSRIQAARRASAAEKVTESRTESTAETDLPETEAPVTDVPETYAPVLPDLETSEETETAEGTSMDPASRIGIYTRPGLSGGTDELVITSFDGNTITFDLSMTRIYGAYGVTAEIADGTGTFTFFNDQPGQKITLEEDGTVQIELFYNGEADRDNPYIFTPQK